MYTDDTDYDREIFFTGYPFTTIDSDFVTNMKFKLVSF